MRTGVGARERNCNADSDGCWRIIRTYLGRRDVCGWSVRNTQTRPWW